VLCSDEERGLCKKDVGSFANRYSNVPVCLVGRVSSALPTTTRASY